MSKAIESGILIGRPFGGVAILIKNSLRNVTQTICCADRYVIVKIRNYLIVCIYLPCTGTTDRLLLCNTIFDDIWSWREQYVDCNIIIGGDFNVNLDSSYSTDDVAKFVNNFSTRNSLVRCDDLFPRAKTATYINSSLNQQSCIDYIFVSSGDQVCGYDVIDPDINYSDHLPLFISLTHPSTVCAKEVRKNNVLTSPQLRWDRADLISSYDFTRCKLESLLVNVNYLTHHLNVNESAYNNNFINQLHDDIVAALNEGAYHYVLIIEKFFISFGGIMIWIYVKLHLLNQIKHGKLLVSRGLALFLKNVSPPVYFIGKKSEKIKTLPKNFIPTISMMPCLRRMVKASGIVGTLNLLLILC